MSRQTYTELCLHLPDTFTPTTDTFNHINTRINPFALREAKIAYKFALSECNRVKVGVVIEENQLWVCGDL